MRATARVETRIAQGIRSPQAQRALSRVPRLLFALGLAILLWLYVTSTGTNEDPSQLYSNIPVDVCNLDPSLVLVNHLPNVSVQVRQVVPLEVNFSNRPTACVDLTNVTAGTRLVPVQLHGVDGYKVLSINPAQVRVVLERAERETLPVTVEMQGSGPKTLPGLELTVQPAEVTVIGSARALANVRQLEAVAPGDQLTPGATLVLPVQAYDRVGKIVQGVTLDPVEVQVTVPTSSTPTPKAVPALPTATP